MTWLSGESISKTGEGVDMHMYKMYDTSEIVQNKAQDEARVKHSYIMDFF